MWRVIAAPARRGGREAATRGGWVAGPNCPRFARSRRSRGTVALEVTGRAPLQVVRRGRGYGPSWKWRGGGGVLPATDGPVIRLGWGAGRGPATRASKAAHGRHWRPPAAPVREPPPRFGGGERDRIGGIGKRTRGPLGAGWGSGLVSPTNTLSLLLWGGVGWPSGWRRPRTGPRPSPPKTRASISGTACLPTSLVHSEPKRCPEGSTAVRDVAEGGGVGGAS